jgi:diaminohydroxyphosphoribosylaminopyrimidine deaminase/5-amino-6-(5-phosphoribosylamino)uracil reductase
MAKNNKNLNYKDIMYIKLAYEQASINVGSTKKNPSVGCIIVKNNTVISSGRTSLNGRPHAESNALEKKLNYESSDLYVTLEPCSHYGKTPPCIKKIISKKIKKVIFSINDTDLRSKGLAHKELKKNNINVKKFLMKDYALNFYKSYILQSSKSTPFIDAKLAVSKDYFTINKNQKWITNNNSRKIGNFLRSKYDCVISTAKSVNNDNSLLNCRIEGLENKSPAVIIIDRSFKIKKNLKIFKDRSRKIFIFTQTKNTFKEKYFKKIGVNIIKLKNSKNSKNNVCEVYFYLKQLGFNRILIESGVKYINEALQNNLIKNFYLFKSSLSIKNAGKNNASITLIKKLKATIKNKVKINLNGDSLYKIQI